VKSTLDLIREPCDNLKTLKLMKTRLTLLHLLSRVLLLALFAPRAEALVYCITNSVDVHQQAPTGTLAQSGWQQTVMIAGSGGSLNRSNFLGTIIYSNALLTANHIWEIETNDTFFLEGMHQLTSKVTTNGSDLAIYFFTPAITNREHIALLNIESSQDTNASVVLQGCGSERGEQVSSGSLTNGWMWSGTNVNNTTWGMHRWGINNFFDATPDGLYAIAAFDNNGDPDECMLTIGDSGGPGFLQTGSGWKLALVNYGVLPSIFTYTTNPATPFYASLYDCAGLYYQGDTGWTWVSTNESPAPCQLRCSRVSQRLDWLTNTIQGLTFPADLGLSWRIPTNQPSREQALNGFWMDVILTNAGPYATRNVSVDLEWAEGFLIKGSSATHGVLTTNHWSLPLLQDGQCATLHVETVIWTGASHWTTNRAVLTISDKPDANTANNEAFVSLLLPQTMSTVILFL
jgi:hypothetical protein